MIFTLRCNNRSSQIGCQNKRHGVKLYPAGMTTNSQYGVRDVKRYYPVFAAMQKEGLGLNLHGEFTNSTPDAATIHDSMNAESNFLPQMFNLHKDFPDLRIVRSS